MNVARTTENKKKRVAELAAKLFRRETPPVKTASPDLGDCAERCRECENACKATRVTAMELTTVVTPRFDESLRKADDASTQACHCEQLTRLYRDMWDNDDCTDADITVALAVALPAYRDQLRSATSQPYNDGELPVLVAPLPGEQHLLSAVFAARAVEAGNQRVDYRVPVSREELASIVAERRYAGVVLVTSTVFSRSRRRAFIEQCAETVRSASRSPLRVVLHGRIAEELNGETLNGIDSVTAATNELATQFEPDIPRIH